MKNCFEGYLTPDCANCPYWADGTGNSIGCAAPFPIMHCSSFERMYNAEQNLDNIAGEAEPQRTTNEEAVYDERISKAEQCLIDNGIEPDEASVVLQALGYILLDEELYPAE